ncbi:MAG TPA: RNA polymerase sigma-70 factor [Acidobacteriota bacterium]|nr:RNA polymerase sigma-70 factor [Acidobacteriota bacterium]
MNRLEVFYEHRPLLFSIAYRMLGTKTDAEDILQEAFLRWQDSVAADNNKAFLVTVVTRLCLDHLKSARIKREQYVGPWLPEPVLESESLRGNPELADSLSMAFLVLLETLSPVERAVFLLREVFEFEYDEVARILGKSEPACRQLLKRAKERLSLRPRRFEPSKTQTELLVQRFMETTATGDLQGLLALLTDDIRLMSDGGGKVVAALNPIHGPDHVARFLIGVTQKFGVLERAVQVTSANGQPALIVYAEDGPTSITVLDTDAGKIRGVFIILNPDKLHHLPQHPA